MRRLDRRLIFGGVVLRVVLLDLLRNQLLKLALRRMLAPRELED
jgi:hypothetical protein